MCCRFSRAGLGEPGADTAALLPKHLQEVANATNLSATRMLTLLLYDYFRIQIVTGTVSVWSWFIDGHLLPYTGKEKVHYSYNTQRRMPVPGRTNIVTCGIG